MKWEKRFGVENTEMGYQKLSLLDKRVTQLAKCFNIFWPMFSCLMKKLGTSSEVRDTVWGITSTLIIHVDLSPKEGVTRGETTKQLCAA